jgi:hypothetical protein
MNEKVVEHIVKLRALIHKDIKLHKDTLADLFLEEDIICQLQEMRWDIMPRHKITLIVEVFP